MLLYCWKGIPKSHESKSPHVPASHPITQQADPSAQWQRCVCVCYLPVRSSDHVLISVCCVPVRYDIETEISIEPRHRAAAFSGLSDLNR